MSMSDNGMALKVYLNEEISRLKQELLASLETSHIKDDELIFEKVKQVSQLLEGFSQKKIDGAMVETILRVQSFIRELQNDAD